MATYLMLKSNEVKLCRSYRNRVELQGDIGETAAIGADKLILEVHPAPEKAISDGAQSLDIPQFQKMMKDLQPYIQLWNESRKTELAAAASR